MNSISVPPAFNYAGPREAIEASVDAVRDKTPLVHCITNTVVQNVTANALLAVGAAPAMVEHPEESGDFAKIASGVLINVGTISDAQAACMRVAAPAALEAGVPWVLDPVAVGGLRVRTELARELLELKPTAIRGNASEVQALAGAGAGGRGVDSTASVDAAVEAAQLLAEKTGAVVAVSGERDLFVWKSEGETRAVYLTSGDPLLTRVIGTGCSLGALTAAYLGASERQTADARAVAVIAAHAHVGAAGQQAKKVASRPGSYAVAWIDALDELSGAQIADLVEVEDAGLGA